jgi:hypothetical protein
VWTPSSISTLVVWNTGVGTIQFILMFKQNFSVRNVGSLYLPVLQWCGQLVKVLCSFRLRSVWAVELRLVAFETEFCYWAVCPVTTAQLRCRPSHFWGFWIPHMAGFLWQVISSLQRSLSTQDKTNTRDEYPCRKRISNPRSQQSSRCRPTPKMTRLLGSACLVIKLSNLYWLSEVITVSFFWSIYFVAWRQDHTITPWCDSCCHLST